VNDANGILTSKVRTAAKLLLLLRGSQKVPQCISTTSIFILFSRLLLTLPSHCFPRVLPTDITYAHLVFPCYLHNQHIITSLISLS